MALVTFSSPDYKDKTVYAVAGSHTETLLKIAKEHKVPVHHDCQDGECGSCLVHVTSVDHKNQRMGGPLTDKEKTVLRPDSARSPRRISSGWRWTISPPNGVWPAR
jgi:ferredoxin